MKRANVISYKLYLYAFFNKIAEIKAAVTNLVAEPSGREE